MCPLKNLKDLEPVFYENALEQSLVAACAQRAVGDGDFSRLRSGLLGRVDWRLFVQEAARHRVLSLVRAGLRKDERAFVPEFVLYELKRRARGIAVRSFQQAAQLVKVIQILQEKGIPAVPFKGPVIAELAYGDILMRPFVDLDILIRRRDAVATRRILLEEGYVEDVHLSEDQISSYLRDENSFSFRHPGHMLFLDLHWELSGYYAPFPMRYEDLEGRFQEITLLSRPVLTLSPEDTVIHHCIHAAGNRWETLEGIACLAGLVHRTPMDWEILLRRAEAMHCRRMLFLGLHLVESIFGAMIPASVLREVRRDPSVWTLSRLVQQDLSCKGSAVPWEGAAWRFSLFHIRVRDTLADALRYGMRLLWRPTIKEHMYFRLPPEFAFLRFFLRPFRLGFLFFQSILRCRQHRAYV